MQESEDFDQKTRSLSFSDGRVTYNRINKVVKSGVKPVYGLVADGRLVKGTLKHRFMTPDGWREMGDLEKGDSVLVTENGGASCSAKFCIDCNKLLSGYQGERCYSCSATFHSNPSKSGEAISAGRKRYLESGGTSWNKGLKRGDDPRWDKACENIPLALTGKTLSDYYPPEEVERIRKRMSEAMQGSKNHMYGKTSPPAKSGHRSDLGHYVRSTWEADFARVLKLIGEDYEYEPQAFHLTVEVDGVTKDVTYTPDFWVSGHDCFYGIKGFMRPLDRAKIEAFRRQCSKTLVLVQKEDMAEIAFEIQESCGLGMSKNPEGI